MMFVKRIVAVMAAIFVAAAPVTVVHAQAPGSAPSPQDRMASAKASMKTRFGFSEAQANTAIQKVQAMTKGYQPRMMTLQTTMQKKYGANPTQAQRQQMQREAIPLIMEITQKTNAVLLSVATKAQRPKLEAQFKSERAVMEKMQAGKM